MTEYYLDCSTVTDRRSLHEQVAGALGFPEYYGKNLDALSDCLDELGSARINIVHAARLTALDTYGMAFLTVLREASERNEGLYINIEN